MSDKLPRALAAFVVPGEPVSKARARFTNYGSRSGRAYTPQRTLEAEKRVRAAFLATKPPAVLGDDVSYSVYVQFYCGTRQRRDIDNMAKLILDGLNGVAWIDDVQVVELGALKRYVKKDEARTEVVIYVEGDLGQPTSPCAHCGKEFRTYPSSENVQRFCQRACRSAFMQAARTVACESCGEPFEKKGPAGRARFCSVACRSKPALVEVVCDGCGVPFIRRRSAVNARNFCTRECYLATPAPTKEIA